MAGMAKQAPKSHRRKPRPEPITIADLYRQETGDADVHHRTIDAHFKKLPAKTQAMMRDRAAGKTFEEISAKHKITRGSIGGRVLRALQRMQLAIAGAPRYWKTGRGEPAPPPIEDLAEAPAPRSSYRQAAAEKRPLAREARATKTRRPAPRSK
jgi:hypothetical protein